MSITTFFMASGVLAWAFNGWKVLRWTRDARRRLNWALHGYKRQKFAKAGAHR